MHLYRKILWPKFCGIRLQTFVVGPENVLKNACFWVPYLRAYCEALRHPFELIFCVVVKDKFANVFQKKSRITDFIYGLFRISKFMVGQLSHD